MRARSLPAAAGSSSPVSSCAGGARVVAVGAEARAGDDEAVEAERGERRAAARRTTVGRADDREAVDELRLRARAVCSAALLRCSLLS